MYIKISERPINSSIYYDSYNENEVKLIQNIIFLLINNRICKCKLKKSNDSNILSFELNSSLFSFQNILEYQHYKNFTIFLLFLLENLGANKIVFNEFDLSKYDLILPIILMKSKKVNLSKFNFRYLKTLPKSISIKEKKFSNMQIQINLYGLWNIKEIEMLDKKLKLIEKSFYFSINNNSFWTNGISHDNKKKRIITSIYKKILNISLNDFDFEEEEYFKL